MLSFLWPGALKLDPKTAMGCASIPKLSPSYYINYRRPELLGYFFSSSDLPQNTDKNQHRFSKIYPKLKFKSML
jgi:hypothetical protein